MVTKDMVNMVKIKACSMGSNTSKNKFSGSGIKNCKNGILLPKFLLKDSRPWNARAITIIPPVMLPKRRKASEMGKATSSMILIGNING